MPLETIPWDVADDLDTPERIALYLEAVLDDGDPALVAAAIGDIARAQGMNEVARKAGLSRDALQRTFSDGGNAQLATLISVLKALGLKLTVSPRSMRLERRRQVRPFHASSGFRPIASGDSVEGSIEVGLRRKRPPARRRRPRSSIKPRSRYRNSDAIPPCIRPRPCLATWLPWSIAMARW